MAMNQFLLCKWFLMQKTVRAQSLFTDGQDGAIFQRNEGQEGWYYLNKTVGRVMLDRVQFHFLRGTQDIQALVFARIHIARSESAKKQFFLRSLSVLI